MIFSAYSLFVIPASEITASHWLMADQHFSILVIIIYPSARINNDITWMTPLQLNIRGDIQRPLNITGNIQR